MKSNQHHHRRSIRLRGYDYTQPGAYFVTICTSERRCILGEIREGTMLLSEVGAIADQCWRANSDHFPQVNGKTYQIMPNHIHGILAINENRVRARDTGSVLVSNINNSYSRGLQLKTPTLRTPTGERLARISPPRNSLGVIVRTFKAAVTTTLRQQGQFTQQSPWQRSYYDHIIRDDVSHFFIQQYVELNPLLWHVDVDNPMADKTQVNLLIEHLTSTGRLSENARRYVADLEADYRFWRKPLETVTQ